MGELEFTNKLGNAMLVLKNPGIGRPAHVTGTQPGHRSPQVGEDPGSGPAPKAQGGP